ncbi:PREDICTED: protein naked cuticle homolog 2-like isoform X1 [Branchiostoma belcheri]|uniref:Protein naked cuticle homolog n=1 Tax=Branchiostoma belcheri TaxID=7741 RepID=A0A6P4YIQ4_BRABE|nr:PREDICTED: protein naked cuticle homolog 2-like isoform X1 [Branchiostoma belcheri]
MGKLQSKHACKRRESPEGDSFVVNAHFNTGRYRGIEDFIARQKNATGLQLATYKGGRQPPVTYKEPPAQEMEKAGGCKPVPVGMADDCFPLEVQLPPETPDPGRRTPFYVVGPNDGDSKSSVEEGEKPGLHVEEFECGVSVEGSDKQEWTFTLYDFDGKGKVTQEDFATLLHSIYEMVGNSVHLPSKSSSKGNKNKTLKLRLTVSPPKNGKAPEKRVETEMEQEVAKDEDGDSGNEGMSEGCETPTRKKSCSANDQMRKLNLHEFVQKSIEKQQQQQQHRIAQLRRHHSDSHNHHHHSADEVRRHRHSHHRPPSRQRQQQPLQRAREPRPPQPLPGPGRRGEPQQRSHHGDVYILKFPRKQPFSIKVKRPRGPPQVKVT